MSGIGNERNTVTIISQVLVLRIPIVFPPHITTLPDVVLLLVIKPVRYCQYSVTSHGFHFVLLLVIKPQL